MAFAAVKSLRNMTIGYCETFAIPNSIRAVLLIFKKYIAGTICNLCPYL